MVRTNYAFAAVAALCFCLASAAEDVPEVKQAIAPAQQTATLTPVSTVPAAARELPFDYMIDDGLYATLTAMTSFKVPEIKEERMYKLAVLGFKKEMQVRAMMHEQPAPLVVILLGLASKSKDPLARYPSCEAMAAELAQFVPDSAVASTKLKQLVAVARNRMNDGRTTDLQPIYKNVLSLLNLGDFASAERLLRQQAEKYPGSEKLAVDARFANTLVLSHVQTTGDQEYLRQVGSELFHSLICERTGDFEGAQQILRRSKERFPTSVLIEMAVVRGDGS